MKAAAIIFITMALSINVASAQVVEQSKVTVTYDSLLAKRVGADEYGMKRYVIAFLKSGPAKIQDSVKRAEIQRAHLKNIMRLAEEGKLIIAGPFLDNQSLRGIFIFNVATVEEARTIAETDPGYQAGVFSLEFHPWYGSAALMEVRAIHERIQKKSVTD